MRGIVVRRIRKQSQADAKGSPPESGFKNAYRHAKRDYSAGKSDPRRRR